jgi:dTDP-4-amino-4,6-dideoxygalactose transaminase
VLCEERDSLKVYLEAAGIETAVHYPTPLPLLKAYAVEGYTAADYPHAAHAAAHMLSLPMYPELSAAQIEYMAKSIKDFYAQR